MRPAGKRYTFALLLILGWIGPGHAQIANPDAKPVPAPPPITLPLTSLVPDARIAIDGDRRIATTGDAVWVLTRSNGTAVRIDPKTNAPDKPVAITKEPCHSFVSAFKSFWAAACGAGALVRFTPPAPPPAKDESAGKPADSKSEKKPDDPIKLITTAIRGAGPLVSATGSIWMITDAKGSVARIDPDTNAVVAEVTIPAGATSLTSAGDALWIASSGKGLVTRINGYSNVVEDTVKVGTSPVAIASGEGSVWTLNGGDGTVSRIDLKTNKVTETIKVGVKGAAGTIVVGEGSVWVTAPGHPLSRIDPKTNRLAQQFTGPGGGVIAIGLKSLWLTATPTEVWRIDPKRVEATVRTP